MLSKEPLLINPEARCRNSSFSCQALAEIFQAGFFFFLLAHQIRLTMSTRKLRPRAGSQSFFRKGEVGRDRGHMGVEEKAH